MTKETNWNSGLPIRYSLANKEIPEGKDLNVNFHLPLITDQNANDKYKE